MTLLAFDHKLENILLEEFDSTDFKNAVAIVQDGDKWLLGLSTATDDRAGKWCFPGGGIKRGENVKRAAVRECKEETGISCRAVGEPFSMPGKKGVAFVHCKVTSTGQGFKNNNEFAGVGFFTKRQMRSLKLYHNVQKLLDRVS